MCVVMYTSIVFLYQWKELQDMMVAWVKKWSRDDNIKELIHEVKYVSDVMFPEVQ